MTNGMHLKKSQKASYHGQILIHLHQISSIGSQWVSRHEINLNLIPQHLPQVVMTIKTIA